MRSVDSQVLLRNLHSARQRTTGIGRLRAGLAWLLIRGQAGQERTAFLFYMPKTSATQPTSKFSSFARVGVAVATSQPIMR